tara:strand:- start:178 stop:543 length:366 start_codon:yes stop_codon:yes gene_type:complete
MKVFQQMQEAIKEWEDSRSKLISIARSLNCNEDQILDKIESLKEARPANDLNAINEKLEELMDGLSDAMGRAEDAESSISSAQGELEYLDAGDAVSAIDDVSMSFDEFRKDIRKQLEESKG